MVSMRQARRQAEKARAVFLDEAALGQLTNRDHYRRALLEWRGGCAFTVLGLSTVV
jgi:hypothetical protein